ncbi:MAG: DoxX family protein [Rhodothermales bacterium]|nr:DoxX family protein [Rhodothermales bacterium]MBO6781492.1 DoxX family protein [Rhodothermales bacterium]
MEFAFHIAKALSVALFLFYGVSCLFAQGMKSEFERFGLARYRRLTGALELLGALGLLVGYAVPLLGFVAAVGLTLLMLLGVGVRIRVQDPFLEMVPAIVLLLVNAYLAWAVWPVLQASMG